MENHGRLPQEAERWFAASIKALREQRGWTQARLARALTMAGLPMHQSAIAKMERPPSDDPKKQPRPIRLNEAAIIASVFGMPLHQMVSPGQQGQSDLARLLQVQLLSSQMRAVAAQRSMEEAEAEVAQLQQFLEMELAGETNEGHRLAAAIEMEGAAKSEYLAWRDRLGLPPSDDDMEGSDGEPRQED